MSLRRTAVAGTWYPAVPARLTAEIAQYSDAAAADTSIPADADVVAVIAPHAGLMYSGPVAAYSYRHLLGQTYDTIVLVGPSHYVPFEGASIWARGAFATPLGNLPIDEETAAAIMVACPLVHELAVAHEREHSLEMQLPFLAALARGARIVPIVMGYQTRTTAYSLGDCLAPAVHSRRALLVASSDLSHFHDARMAAALDRQVIEQVDRFDADGLMDLLEDRPDHACGGGPMVAVMRAARALGATHARVLHYADSGDVSGDKSSVVGYLAAVLWR